MKQFVVSAIQFVIILLVMTFLLSLIGALVEGSEWLDEPLDNFDLAFIVAFVLAIQTMHEYEDH